MNRRHFLMQSGNSLMLMGLAQMGFPWRQAQAATQEPWFFVQVALRNGWDVTLGLDPWLKQRPDEKEMFIEYDPSNIEKVGSLALGPALLPMKSFMNEMVVINGIFMSENDNGHDAAEKYIRSGSTGQEWGSLPVEIFESRKCEILGVLNNRLDVGARSPVSASIRSVEKLATEDLNSTFFQSSQNAGNHLSQIEEMILSRKSDIDLLKTFMLPYLQEQGPKKDAALIASAFAASLSQVASYDMNENLDTHANHPGAHLQLQTKLWSEVADFLNVFKATPYGTSGKSLFDHTTFMFTSEFARTPALNAARGKDHNPMTNSVALLGPRFKGNTLLGASTLVTSNRSKDGQSKHIALGLDRSTGQVLHTRRDDALIVRPENIAVTITESLGISRGRFAPVGPKVPSLFNFIRK